MRTLTCPICKNIVILYEKDGKIYPNLDARIRRHVEAHKLEEILNPVYDAFYEQVVKFQDEITALNNQNLSSNPKP